MTPAGLVSLVSSPGAVPGNAAGGLLSELTGGVLVSDVGVTNPIGLPPDSSNLPLSSSGATISSAPMMYGVTPSVSKICGETRELVCMVVS